MNEKIPFSPPRIDDLIIDEVTDTLRSGWITTGPKTKRFEQEITNYTGAKKTLCLNSGTAGMEIALRWFGVGPGDEVIIPSYTYCSTAHVVVHCGATPVMVDVGEDFNIDVEQVRAKITEKTKAVIPVDIAGFPCDYQALNALVRDPEIVSKFSPNHSNQEKLGRILLMADAAHSFGASYQGKRSGSLADISVFSFHAVKNLTTAEGGAMCLNLPEEFDQEDIYRELNVFILHGQSKDALAKFKAGGWKYDVTIAGHKFNMTDMAASMGLIELHRYDNDTLVRRKEIFSYYNERLSDHDWAILPPEQSDQKQTSYHLYMLRLSNLNEEQRSQLIELISADQIAVNVHFIPLPMLTLYKELGYRISDYPEAFKQYQHELSLPLFYNLRKDQQDRVVDSVAQAYEKVR